MKQAATIGLSSAAIMFAGLAVAIYAIRNHDLGATWLRCYVTIAIIVGGAGLSTGFVGMAISARAAKSRQAKAPKPPISD